MANRFYSISILAKLTFNEKAKESFNFPILNPVRISMWKLLETHSVPSEIICSKPMFVETEYTVEVRMIGIGNYTKLIVGDSLVFGFFPEIVIGDLMVIEVLKHIKTSNELKHIPVVMLTTSSYEEDIVKSYKNYANCYITKPIDVKDFIKVVEKIENFWISIVQLP